MSTSYRQLTFFSYHRPSIKRELISRCLLCLNITHEFSTGQSEKQQKMTEGRKVSLARAASFREERKGPGRERAQEIFLINTEA
jgi:hypothetical protein